MKKVLLLLTAFIIITSGCNSLESKKIKYVFLMIGDGMGVNQVYTTELYKASLEGKIGNVPLNLSQLPVQSYATTYSASNYITCSSAAGTALASGHKTANGVLGKDSSLTVSFETVAEKAHKKGFKVGILTSVSIDHATPASFYAHQNSRNDYYEISMQLPESGFDYFGGGGFEYPQGRDKQQPDAFDQARQMGYRIIKSQQAFDSLKPGDEKIMAINPKTYPKGEFYWNIDQVEGSISLADFTRKGIELIDNPKGFFMMVEGGKIDWACHANDAASAIHEVLAFDDAVSVALEFYKQHPDETLVIVTADHETGGMASGVKGMDDKLNLKLLANQKVSLQEFHNKLYQYRATNPTASFEEVLALIQDNFGLGDVNKGLELSQKDKDWLYEGYANYFLKKEMEDTTKEYDEHDNTKNLAERCVALLDTRAGVGWTTGDHTGMPVPVRVIGPGQDLFKSYMDNTDIPKRISQLMGLTD